MNKIIRFEPVEALDQLSNGDTIEVDFMHGSGLADNYEEMKVSEIGDCFIKLIPQSSPENPIYKPHFSFNTLLTRGRVRKAVFRY